MFVFSILHVSTLLLAEHWVQASEMAPSVHETALTSFCEPRDDEMLTDGAPTMAGSRMSSTPPLGQIGESTTSITSPTMPNVPVATPLTAAMLKVAHMCKHCDFSATYFSRFFQHMKEVHPEARQYGCATCKITFTAASRYRKHYIEFHKSHLSFVEADASTTDYSEVECDGYSVHNLIAENLSQPEPSVLSDEARLSDLCRMLEGKHRSAKSVVDAVVEGVSGMFRAKGHDLNVCGLSTDKERKRLYENKGIYVKPCEKVLSNGSKAYYVELRSLLQNLFRHPTVASYLQRPFCFSSDGFLRDYCDGVRFSSNAVLKNKDNALALLLYCDDVELANPLGMKRGTCGKLTLFYVMFANFPASKRSHLNSIFLLAVAHSKDVKTVEGKTELLQDFVATMNELSSAGISIQLQERDIRIYGCLLAFLGDNLACHNIAGFKESFSPNVRHACRRCNARTSNFSNIFLHNESPLRTDSEIQSQVQQLLRTENIMERNELSASCGIKGPSVLSLIAGFSLCDDLLFDPMHILLEGVVPKEISLFLYHQIHNLHNFSRRQLNDCLSNFHFDASVSSSDYPRSFDATLSLVSSASATAVLMLHLPLMLDSIVSLKQLGPTFECFILVCQVTQLILSPVLSVEALGDLETTIIKHQRLYLSCYGERAFTPKLHMLLHIVAQIKQHGPGHHHWTMRCEGKNALPKSKKLFNFKNVPFSVSEFFQINLSYSMWHGNGDAKHDFLDVGSDDRAGVPYCLTKSFVRAGLPSSAVGSLGCALESVVSNNVTLSLSDVMMTRAASGGIGFTKITAIVQYFYRSFFLCRVLVLQRYDPELNCFVLRETCHETIVTSHNFLLPWPMYVYPDQSALRCLCKYYTQLP